ncbi:unnamed protein product [Cylindrotheca closterium]|uniref:Uncharacterized protein n=1 Tax=Cylindrotheca closterium TaxID=2856 RepID=A0AAD2PWL7_9STRA|nr:unnamed protein product [Cylindrotheca closterium]
MNRIPMLIRGQQGSFRSEVSQISFDDDSLMSDSTHGSPIVSSKRPCKWSSETEPCHLGLSEHHNSPVFDKSERRSSTKPIPKPERKCSSDDLFDLSIADARSLALKQAMMGCRTQTQTPQSGQSKPQPSTRGDNPIDKFWSTKKSPRKQTRTLGGSSKPKMANAQWDLVGSPTGDGNKRRNSRWDFPENDSGPSLGTLLSTIAASSSSSSSNGRSGGGSRRRTVNVDMNSLMNDSAGSSSSKMRPSFSRISMNGLIENGSMDLRKPSRKRSKEGQGLTKGTARSNPDIMTKGLKGKKNSSFASSRKGSYHSTMPLTMPVRKTSTQDLLNLASSGSSNALRSKLSRSKLSRSKLNNSGVFNPMAPRRMGSASSMLRNQSKERLRRHG